MSVINFDMFVLLKVQVSVVRDTHQTVVPTVGAVVTAKVSLLGRSVTCVRG
jgi:hypothetical protein